MCRWVSTTSVTAAGIDTGGLQSMDRLPGPREVRELHAQSGVDEDGPVAAAHHDHVQRPVEHVVRQEPVIQPLPVLGRVGVGRLRLGGDRQHPVADHQHLDVADLHARSATEPTRRAPDYRGSEMLSTLMLFSSSRCGLNSLAG